MRWRRIHVSALGGVERKIFRASHRGFTAEVGYTGVVVGPASREAAELGRPWRAGVYRRRTLHHVSWHKTEKAAKENARKTMKGLAILEPVSRRVRKRHKGRKPRGAVVAGRRRRRSPGGLGLLGFAIVGQVVIRALELAIERSKAERRTT